MSTFNKEIGVLFPTDKPFDELVEKVKKVFLSKNARLVFEMDYQKSILEETQDDIGPMILFGFCWPSSAYEWLKIDKSLGFLFPIRCLVFMKDGKATLAFQNVMKIAELLDNERAKELASDGSKFGIIIKEIMN
ncbi:hypothetical protein M0813_02783 [Anaeramoeba flamelloides]|uniref:DUF302 domain-containing protein n=1 Tax=Anaeramoeba flamelloides TaxID=1746091 RepID=A0AAV8A081_9EUKA|nr:hypothetical protein M0812_11449 [Anaeramoeba flamelloides]KAJ6242927.1 hypothetical protein M0813_02783 [Anaeramoeba flamelloides]